jgi:hypothetical protein
LDGDERGERRGGPAEGPLRLREEEEGGVGGGERRGGRGVVLGFHWSRSVA